MLQKHSLLYLKVIPFLKLSTDIKNQINQGTFIEEFTQLSYSIRNNFGIQLSDDVKEKNIQEQEFILQKEPHHTELRFLTCPY